MNKRKSLLRKESIEGYLCALPWFIGFFVFVGGPVVVSFIFSFCKYDGFSQVWIGSKNYVDLFHDPCFFVCLYNTVYYTFLSVPLSTAIALFVAMLLNQDLKGKALLRTIYYLPSVTSGVALCLLWLWLFDPNLGLVNAVLEKIGIYGPLWLQSPTWSKPALIIMSFWTIGPSIVIYLAALQGVPQYLYEAAEIDGASEWQKFLTITLPGVSPSTFFIVIIGIINSFQVFIQAYVMTAGGPQDSTLFYVLYLYNQGFRWYHMGYASAMAWILFGIIFAFSIIMVKSSYFWVYYEQ